LGAVPVGVHRSIHYNPRRKDYIMTTNQKPILVIRDGRISASIFENRNEKGAFYATVFQRLYTDGEGNVKHSSSFSGVELLKLSRLSAQAYDRILELRGSKDDADEA
jgi:hypothetical protein